MRRLFLSTCLFLGLLIQCRALDLTPRPRVSGVMDATARFFFKDEAKKFGFRVDPKTRVSGNPARAVFELTDLETSGMTIDKSPLDSRAPFTGDSLKQYGDLAHAALPAGATDVVLEQELPNAISINGWTSRQYVFTCNFYGVKLRRSITFVNFSPKDQLLIAINAPVKNYDKTYARCYGILNSIYSMKPGEDGAEPGN
jgi:hypothetical protein